MQLNFSRGSRKKKKRREHPRKREKCCIYPPNLPALVLEKEGKKREREGNPIVVFFFPLRCRPK